MGRAAAIRIAELVKRIVQHFRFGYSDGCRTAHTRIEGFEKKTVHRNEALYEREENYREGWKNGYGTCGGATRGNNNELFNERGSAQPWDAGRF